jgi:hypothetical protein
VYAVPNPDARSDRDSDPDARSYADSSPVANAIAYGGSNANAASRSNPRRLGLRGRKRKRYGKPRMPSWPGDFWH